MTVRPVKCKPNMNSGHKPDISLQCQRVRTLLSVTVVRYVTFDGIAKACAKAGGFPEPELVHFNPKDFDFGALRAGKPQKLDDGRCC